MTIALFIMIAAATAATPPVSIFGIEIGEPLGMKECIPMTDPVKYRSDTSKYKSSFYYKHPEGSPCYERLKNQVTDVPITNEIVHVKFPLGERLAAASDNTVVVQLLDRRAAYIRFNTRGMPFQSEDLATFTGKFGKPVVVEPVALQNGFGANFKAITAIWKPSPTTTASYSSFSSGRYGDFSVGTAAGKAALEAPLRALMEPTRGL